MTTFVEAEGLIAEPPVLQPAANEDFAATLLPTAGWGWDPYQVWLTRIKAVQEAIIVRVAS